MGLPALITIVGTSPPYLESRAKVLQHFWMVETVSLDAEECPRFETDLLVVSASVPEPHRQKLVESARRHDPTLLIVRTDGFDSGPLNGADATVDEGRGPGALVATIYELLTQRGLSSRNWRILQAGGWVQ